MSDSKQGPAGADGLSRRAFLGAAAATTAGLAVTGKSYAADFHYSPGYLQGAAPNSIIAGVNLGTITYSFRSMPGGNDALQLLGYVVAAGISTVELMGAPIMNYLGAPTVPGGGGGGGAPGAQAAPDPEVVRQRAAAQAELNRFLTAGPDLTKLAELKKKYNDAGVTIHLTKLNANTAEAADFAFRASRALGAVGNTTELAEDPPKLQGPIARKYGMKAGFHTHLQPGEPNFAGYDHYLAMDPGVYLNIDLGHYYAATGKSPVPEMVRLHDRIVSVHLKDRTSPEWGQDNVKWGEGGTPIPDILRTMYREKYTFPADIELEYPVPEGSDAVKEISRCLELCRDVLTRVSTPRPQRAPAAPAAGAPTSAPRP